MIPWPTIDPTLLKNGGGHPSGKALLQLVLEDIEKDGDVSEKEARELLDRGRSIWRAGGIRADCHCRDLTRSAVRLIGYNLCALGRGYGIATDLFEALAKEAEALTHGSASTASKHAD